MSFMNDTAAPISIMIYHIFTIPPQPSLPTKVENKTFASDAIA